MPRNTIFEHKGCVIEIIEHTQMYEGKRHTDFSWIAKHYGKEIGSGREPVKAHAAGDAMEACEQHLAIPHRFKINLEPDGSVVTKDGEYLGTWIADENDHPSFIPDGETEPLFFDVFIGSLCAKIDEWHQSQG